MKASRKMLDVVREEWAEACDGDEMDMANWAIKWGNPLMGAMERRVLNRELESRIQGLVEALEKYADRNNWGYLDGSGCPKGIGRYTDACFIGLEPADQALTAYKEGK